MVQLPVIVDFMRECLAEARRTYKTELSNDVWMKFTDERKQVFGAKSQSQGQQS